MKRRTTGGPLGYLRALLCGIGAVLEFLHFISFSFNGVPQRPFSIPRGDSPRPLSVENTRLNVPILRRNEIVHASGSSFHRKFDKRSRRPREEAARDRRFPGTISLIFLNIFGVGDRRKTDVLDVRNPHGRPGPFLRFVLARFSVQERQRERERETREPLSFSSVGPTPSARGSSLPVRLWQRVYDAFRP